MVLLQLIVGVSDRTDSSVEPGVRRFYIELTDSDDNDPVFIGCPQVSDVIAWFYLASCVVLTH